MQKPLRLRLGDVLLQHKIITPYQLDQAIEAQQLSGAKLGEILLEKNFLTENQLLTVLAEQLNLPTYHLKNFTFDKELVALLPESYARRYKAIILERKDEHLVVGMADPLDIYGYDEISSFLHQPIQLALVKESEVLQSINLLYRRTQEIHHYADELSQELTPDHSQSSIFTDGESQTPVAKLLNSIFMDAVQVEASDIHIEPDKDVLRIRFRVDGDLSEQVVSETSIVTALTLRLKLMAGLNIAEKRLPQDGRFSIHILGRSIDVRLSTMPIHHGESVVMRLLDQSAQALTLEQTGMPMDMMATFRHLIHRPYGMILVTGPTGSGKTTTLYSALNEINEKKRKIITVEDPIEYQLPRINQVQVNPKIDLSFSRILRSALRQDPDILLVGEIRDQETASIALRAAMTGHLVLATMHTNDTLSSAVRLMDMGVESYLVAAALRAVLAQRLVKRICDNCAVITLLEPHQRQLLRTVLDSDIEREQFKTGKGCPHCNHTGYKGRIGIFELLTINDKMADALRQNHLSEFSSSVSEYNRRKSLTLNAYDYATQGIISIEEVIRIAGDLDIGEVN